MTIVIGEENGNNGHHAGGVWRGGRCPSSLDTRAGALARFGRIDRSKLGSICFGVVGPKRGRRNSMLVTKLGAYPSSASVCLFSSAFAPPTEIGSKSPPTRFVPNPHMTIVTDREGVVAVCDTSQLLDRGDRVVATRRG
jgi:hypothetical protein